LHKRLHTHRTLPNMQVELNAKRESAAFLQSPLTDSNRRPPPYHGGALPTELRGREAGLYPGLGGNDRPVAEEEKQLLEDAKESREETRELREKREAEDESEGEPWAKTSSGD